MKLIKTYSGNKALKHIQFDHTDEEEFKMRFGMSEAVAKNLCEYLKDNDKIVDMKETYDPQSFWGGFEFIIDNVDLSVNGFNFKVANVSKFLEGNWK